MDFQCAGDGVGDLMRLAQSSKGDKGDAILEIPRRPLRRRQHQTCLANATGAQNRHEPLPGIEQKIAERGKLTATSNKRCLDAGEAAQGENRIRAWGRRLRCLLRPARKNEGDWWVRSF